MLPIITVPRMSGGRNRRSVLAATLVVVGTRDTPLKQLQQDLLVLLLPRLPSAELRRLQEASLLLAPGWTVTA